MFAEVLSGTVEDDFNMRSGFAEDLGEFLDGEVFLVEEPERHKFVTLEFVLGDFPKRDGVVWLLVGFGGVIGVEEFAGRFDLSPLGDGLAAGDGKKPGKEFGSFFKGVEFSKSEEEGFLGQVFGVFASTGKFVEEGVDFLVIAVDDFIGRREVAPASRADEIGIRKIVHR